MSRFVDDVTLAPTVIPEGTRLVNGKLSHFPEHVEEDKTVPGDKRTMDVIRELANDISDEIKVTYDIPSNYEDKKVPILDLKVGINSSNKIEYIFYQKPMNNRTVVSKDSAFSTQQKMAILSQECFRRLHNTSETANEEVKTEIMDSFMQQLQCSGYSESDRLNILKSGINTYRRLKMMEYSNKRPFYRPNKFQKTIRKDIKAAKKNNWFKGNNPDSKFKSVLYVDATPGDKLFKMVKATEEKHKISEDIRLKVVSKAGVKLVNMFERKNPFAKTQEECDCKLNILLGETSKRICKCRINNVNYQAQCKNCDSTGKSKIYDGETARNLIVRSNEHYNDLRNGNPNSFMKKHIDKDHAGNEDGVEFGWKVIKKNRKAIERQLTEAVNIKHKASNENLNSKSEFNNQRIRRLGLDRRLNCNTCGSQATTNDELQEHVNKFHKIVKCNQCNEECFGQRGFIEHKKNSHNNQTN